MDFLLPPVGEGLIEVELARWLVAPGETVSRQQLIAEVTSDKAQMELPAPFEGRVTRLLGSPGDKLAVGAAILEYEPLDAPAPPHAPPTVVPVPASVPPTPVAVTPSVRVAASPSVRRLARDRGVDLATVTGSGPGGRVLADDVVPPVQMKPTSASTTVRLTGIRRAIAGQMVRAKEAPHFTYVDEFDLTELVRLRNQLKGPLADAGVKLSYLPFVLKAVTRALADVPAVNATFDGATSELTTHAAVHLGVAVAGPAGLVVPVIRDCGGRGVVELARELDRLTGLVRSGKVTRADLGGSTFTVSSIGGIGGLIATPILNAPEVGIVAMGKVVPRPMFDDHDRVFRREMAFFSFSFDHRVIDGAVAAEFGNRVAAHLATPALLLVGEQSAGGP